MSVYQKKLSFIIGIIFILLSSCSLSTVAPEDFVSNSYKILKTSSILYDTSMNTIVDMDENNKLSTNDKNKVIKYANQYIQTYQLSVTYLENYKLGMINKTEAQTQIDSFLNILNKFIVLVNEIKGDK